MIWFDRQCAKNRGLRLRDISTMVDEVGGREGGTGEEQRKV